MKLKLGLRPPCSRFNNCLLVYFNGDPPTTRPPPLLPRGGLDGEEAGGGTSHSPLPPGTTAAAGPRAAGGRAVLCCAGRAAPRRGRGRRRPSPMPLGGARGCPAPRPQGQWQPPRWLAALRCDPGSLLPGTRTGEKGEGKNEKSPSLSEGQTLNVALCGPPSEEPRSQARLEQSALIGRSVGHIHKSQGAAGTFLFPFFAPGKTKNRKEKIKENTHVLEIVSQIHSINCISLPGTGG